jgi:hypothetical protein
MTVYSIEELNLKQELLLDEFIKFIVKHKNQYTQYLFQHFKTKYPEKYETITMQCDNMDRLNEMICDEFLSKLVH